MEDYLKMSSFELQRKIDEQLEKISELKKTLEKTKEIARYRKEHLQRLEKKNSSLFEENTHISQLKHTLTQEHNLLNNNREKVDRIQVEVDQAVEFVKQTPLDGINFLLQDLTAIQSELSQIGHIEKAQLTSTRIYQVGFKSETCLIRAATPSYTFGELTNDAALYFNLIPEDCLMRDESGTIWSSNLRLMDEFNPSENKLILGLKFGRIARNPNASEINWSELAAHIKLETRIQQMTKWVVEKGKSGQKRGVRDQSILKSLVFFTFYINFLFLLFYTVFAPISLRDAYQLNNSLQNIFVDQEFPQNCDFPDGLTINFLKIVRSEQFFCWFQNVLINELFDSPDVDSENNRIFVLRYNQLGGIRFKQSRVKKNSCEALEYHTGKVNPDQSCYAEYSTGVKSTENYGPYLISNYTCSGLDCTYMQAFKYSASPPDSFSITGKVTKYGASGFYIDSELLLENGTLTEAALSGLGDYLQKYLWIDVGSRAVLVVFSFYNINYNYFTSFDLLLETSSTGYIKTIVKVNTLYLNYYYDSWNNMARSGEDFFIKVPELYCYVYTLFGIIVPTLIQINRNFRSHLTKMWSYLDIALILLVCGILVLRVVLYFICNDIITSIAQKSFNKVTDLSLANFYLSISWGFEAFAALTASLRLLKYFKIQSMTIIWDTLERGAKSIFAFFVVFIVLMCSFTQIVNLVYGPNLETYLTFSTSISSLFMILLGALDNYPSMSKASAYFTPVFFIVFMFLMFFVIMNIFVAILNESFSVVVEMQEKADEKQILGNFKNRLVAEVKFISERIRYWCKKCCRRSKVERSAAFQAFNKT